MSPAQRLCIEVEELIRSPYGHGAYMGAAPLLLDDPTWKEIMRTLLPEVMLDMEGKSAAEIILMAENNPVMAAFGVCKLKEADQSALGGRSNRLSNLQAFEWDCFLPTEIMNALVVAETLEEKQARADELVECMLIAHGQAAQSKAESEGIPQYESVKQNRLTQQGGMTPHEWFTCFTKSCAMAKGEIVTGSEETWQASTTPLKDLVLEGKATLGIPDFSLFLDVKSLQATPEVLCFLVQALNRRGIHVYGIGSFTLGQLEGVEEITQEIAGQQKKTARPVKLFDSIFEVMHDVTTGHRQAHELCLFNGGTLIQALPYGEDDALRAHEQAIGNEDGSGFCVLAEQPHEYSYFIPKQLLADLEEVKANTPFSLGMYVQENDLSPRAAALLSMLCNQRQDLFDAGCALGVVPGKVPVISPVKGRSQHGLADLEPPAQLRTYKGYHTP